MNPKNVHHRCPACQGPTDYIGLCFNQHCEYYRGERTDSVQYNYQTPLATDIRQESEGHPWAFYAQETPFTEEHSGLISYFWQRHVGHSGEFPCPGCVIADSVLRTSLNASHGPHTRIEDRPAVWFQFLVNEIERAESMLEFPMAPYSWKEVQAELEKDEPWFCFDGVMSIRLPNLNPEETAVVWPKGLCGRINNAAFAIGALFAEVNPPPPSSAVTAPEPEGRKFTCSCDVAPPEACPVHGIASSYNASARNSPMFPREDTNYTVTATIKSEPETWRGDDGEPLVNEMCHSRGCILREGHEGMHTHPGEFGDDEAPHGRCSGCQKPFTEAGGLRIEGIPGRWCVRCCKTKQIELNAPPAVEARPSAVETRTAPVCLCIPSGGGLPAYHPRCPLHNPSAVEPREGAVEAPSNAEGSPERIYGEGIRPFLPERKLVMFVPESPNEGPSPNCPLVNENVETCLRCGQTSRHLDSEGLCIERCSPF